MDYTTLKKKQKKTDYNQDGFYFEIEKLPFFTKKRIIILSVLLILLIVIIFNLIAFNCFDYTNVEQVIKNDFNNINKDDLFPKK